MAKFTNTGKGPRGITLKSGDTLYLDRNETVELDKGDVAKVHGDIEEGAKAAKEAEAAEAEAESVAPKKS